MKPPDNKLSFSEVIKTGRALTAKAVEVRYRLRNEGLPRLGIAVSTRFAKRATERNAFKRQVREAFRHCREGLPPADVIVRLRAPLVTPARLCRNDICDLFAQLCRARSSS